LRTLLATTLAAVAASPLTLSGTDVVTGKRFSTAAYRGKPVLIVVWSSW
jgi:hypothetical protein